MRRNWIGIEEDADPLAEFGGDVRNVSAGKQQAGEQQVPVKLGSCTYCGEPAAKLCSQKHRDWTIIEPPSLEVGDIVIRPLDGKQFAVALLSLYREQDSVLIETKQKHMFTIRFLNLPILVKRLIVCGYPCCELHCHKCMRFAEVEEIRDHLLGMKQSRKVRTLPRVTKVKR